MFDLLRKIMMQNYTPLELTNFYGLSAPSIEATQKRDKKVKQLIMQMGHKHRLAVSVRK